MGKIAQVEFETDNVMEVQKNTYTSINELFSVDSRGKKIDLLANVPAGADLVFKANKLESLKVKAEAAWWKQGDKPILSEFLRYADLSAKMKVKDNIKRLEKLAVTIETPSILSRIFKG